ncbi:MAG: GNAT family N-acetyltransferase [Elusimicrobiales bacterium]|nr:GNAT family N-acetyltransferase [Elusimicrobiales bacterium]
MGELEIGRVTEDRELRACARCMAATDPWLKLGRGYKACLAGLAAPREIYAARDGGRLAGFVVLQRYGVLNGYIQTLCVMPGRRGLGVGTRLMRFAEEIILKKGPNVFICVSSFNDGALRLYRRLGYRKGGVLKDFIMRGYDEILLRKTLGSFSEFQPPRRGTKALVRTSSRGTERE